MSTNIIDILPKRTLELTQVVGFKTAMILVKQFGGTHLNIPKKAKAHNKLIDVIGFDALEKLCAYYGGTALEIDLCVNIINQQKKQLIISDIKSGVTNGIIARKYNTTERNIRRIKHDYINQPVNYHNLDIFELT